MLLEILRLFSKVVKLLLYLFVVDLNLTDTEVVLETLYLWIIVAINVVSETKCNKSLR